MRRILILLTAAVVATAGLVAAGLLLTGEEAPDPPASSVAAPLSERDTRDLAVPRAAFCDGIPEEWVADLLGTAPGTAHTWDNGGMLPAVAGVRDVAHEYGCRWAAGGTAVEGWVFAPPVTRARARALVQDARTATGCTPVAGAAPLGEPSTAVSCAGGKRAVTTYAGLLGDAWLTCRVSAPAAREPGLAETVDRWCGMVVASLVG